MFSREETSCYCYVIIATSFLTLVLLIKIGQVTVKYTRKVKKIKVEPKKATRGNILTLQLSLRGATPLSSPPCGALHPCMMSLKLLQPHMVRLFLF